MGWPAINHYQKYAHWIVDTILTCSPIGVTLLLSISFNRWESEAMIYTVHSEALPAYKADFHTAEEAESNAIAVAVITGRTTTVVTQ